MFMLRTLFSLVLLVTLAGWTVTARAADITTPVDLSGSWNGNWLSCESGHKGPLSATFCKLNDTCYQVRFTGRFFAVIPFRYSVNMQVVGQDQDKIYLTGS